VLKNKKSVVINKQIHANNRSPRIRAFVLILGT